MQSAVWLGGVAVALAGGSFDLGSLVALGLPLPFGWRRWRWSRGRFIVLSVLSWLCKFCYGSLTPPCCLTNRRASIKWGALVLLCALPLALPWVSQGQEPQVNRANQANRADRDGNGLIEIDSLTELHNMRYDPTGASYKTSTASVGDSSGCPTTGCIGYELMQDLDFDVNGDGRTWSGSGDEGYSLHVGLFQADSHADYFPFDGERRRRLVADRRRR